jgi:hypothetical protein
MAISPQTRKKLWARSGSRCALCRRQLIESSEHPNDDETIIGDECHIVARSPGFARGETELASPEELDDYSNLILLCKVDHKRVDDQPAQYTVAELERIKKSHECDVERALSTLSQPMDLRGDVYRLAVEQWIAASGLDQWLDLSRWVATSQPAVPAEWFEKQRKIQLWLLGRVWSGRHKGLEVALENYRRVLDDFLTEFERRSSEDDRQPDMLVTRQFYKLGEWDPPRYHRLLDVYRRHVALVNNLFLELSRAANLVCDHVRASLDPQFRVAEGAVLVEPRVIPMEQELRTLNLSYRTVEHSEVPYPGLERFSRLKPRERDFVVLPDQI